MRGSILQTAQILGTVVFAVSGVLAVAGRRLDVFGVAVVGVLTAVGGGTLRSFILQQPPPWLGDWVFLAVAVLASWATVVVMRFAAGSRDRWSRGVLYADAAGLGLFAVTGATVSIAAGYDGVLAVVLGLLTGIGGGLIRDVLVGQTPLILRSDIYATAAIAGTTVYVVLENLGVEPAVAGLVGGGIVFGLRIAAIRWSWSLPSFGPRTQPE